MRTTHATGPRPRLSSIISKLVLLCSMVLLSACGGDVHIQQQASSGQTNLDNLLTYARSIGVSSSLLQPIANQERQLKQTNAPLVLFNNQPASDYYNNLSQRYAQLAVETRGVIASYTQQTQQTAQNDVQNLQLTLAQRHSQQLPVQAFTQELSREQGALNKAQYPKDYLAISGQAKSAVQALNLMPQIASRLTTLNSTINQMQQDHLDTWWLQTQYQSDQQTMATTVSGPAMQNLNTTINAQYMQAVVQSTQAIPYVAKANLDDFANQIQQLKTYGIDPTPYQKKLDADRSMLQGPLNLSSYISFSQRVNTDVASIHSALLQGQAHYLVNQFHQEVNNWGNAHLYHDSYDGQNYSLVAGYGDNGIGSDLDSALSSASSDDDYQSVITLANNDLFNLHLLEADYQDQTPYDQTHQTDIQALQHYDLMHGQVIVVSLVNQALRLYQDGKLVRGFQVTTGREELPSLPGIWTVLARLSPTVFKSPDPPGSPYWYPDTPINYAIEYHDGGYFIHDSWWRVNYGPGTQFPHYDTGGDEQFANSGSHGCINLPESDAGWLYNNTSWSTSIIVY
jgi:hypothetical protein